MRTSVTLQNCENEPIHIPGRIQSHGAMLVLDARTRRVLRHSSNVETFFGKLAQGATAPTAQQVLNLPAVEALLVQAGGAEGAGSHASLNSVDVEVDGATLDVVVHRVGRELVCEFEARGADETPIATFSKLAHRSMDRLKRLASVSDMLSFAVESVQNLTGFDRVMAYRFLHDDSGEVVAERRIEELEPFLGRRYPAGDIPVQARRLYIENSLRLIGDVQGTAQDVIDDDAGLPPLDMSHCLLRSVSPIHIEYLRNMGVGASMSISIVLNGRLWGMLACHHRDALHVPYAIRMACDVMAQLLAAQVQNRLTQDLALKESETTALRGRLVEAVLYAHDAFGAMARSAPALGDAFDAHAVVISYRSGVHIHGDIAPAAVTALLQWLTAAQGDGLVAVHERTQLPLSFQELAPAWCGILGIRVDAGQAGWLVLARKEQIETISWGGNPEKQYASGPLGPRLTPRGSFDLWKQTVLGTSVPWSASELGIARRMRDELTRACASRSAEVHNARAELLAMLGHDLRDPLQAIKMASELLGRSLPAGSASERLGQRIQNSTARMSRLVGHVLDASRLESGQGIEMRTTAMDLGRLLNETVDEIRVAYPASEVRRSGPDHLEMVGDSDRLAQVLGNLLSNARHHGQQGQPVYVTLGTDGAMATLSVANLSPPIDPAFIPHLFQAFKRERAGAIGNRTGLGLGLHIAQAVVLAHRGTIAYSHDDGHVVFTVRLPL